MCSLQENSRGNYLFASGIRPYSAGVVAAPGYEVVRAVLMRAQPYRQGFRRIAEVLEREGRPRQALCAIELRSPQPHTFEGFSVFNEEYLQLLTEWDLLIDGGNPIARTNVAPVLYHPAEPSLYAFSYIRPSNGSEAETTFVVSGAGELSRTGLDPRAVVRKGETSEDAMREKAACVMQAMQTRLDTLQATWSQVTAVNIYTAHNVFPFLRESVLSRMEQANEHGVRQHYARPPIEAIEFEMDLRGVRQENYI